MMIFLQRLLLLCLFFFASFLTDFSLLILKVLFSLLHRKRKRGSTSSLTPQAKRKVKGGEGKSEKNEKKEKGEKEEKEKEKEKGKEKEKEKGKEKEKEKEKERDGVVVVEDETEERKREAIKRERGLEESIEKQKREEWEASDVERINGVLFPKDSYFLKKKNSSATLAIQRSSVSCLLSRTGRLNSDIIDQYLAMLCAEFPDTCFIVSQKVTMPHLQQYIFVNVCALFSIW